jgi:hypothetical protein
VRVGERLGLEDGGVERAVEQDLSHGSLVSSSSLSEQQQRRPAEAEQSHATGQFTTLGTSKEAARRSSPRNRETNGKKRRQRRQPTGNRATATCPHLSRPRRAEQSNRGWGGERSGSERGRGASRAFCLSTTG